MEKYVYYNELYLIYKELLNSSEQEIFDMYYGDNLTMQEIADNLGISKARVGIVIKRVTNKLDSYESILKLHDLRKELDSILEDNDIKVIKNKINKILKGE